MSRAACFLQGLSTPVPLHGAGRVSRVRTIHNVLYKPDTKTEQSGQGKGASEIVPLCMARDVRDDRSEYSVTVISFPCPRVSAKVVFGPQAIPRGVTGPSPLKGLCHVLNKLVYAFYLLHDLLKVRSAKSL